MATALDKRVEVLEMEIAELKKHIGIEVVKPLTALKDLQTGDKFNLAGHVWIVLEHDGVGTLVTTAECVGDRAFDDREDYHNSFRSSTIREYLNGEFLTSLIETEEVTETQIMVTPWDLTSSDGVDRYGQCADRIGLLSENQYNAYKEILALNDWWWLITPDASYAHDARSVYSDGTLYNYHAYIGDIGVRPALRLVSEILVWC